MAFSPPVTRCVDADALALRLLLAAPYLLFAVHPPMPVAAAAVFVAGAGYAATLPLQEQLLALTPDPVRGQGQGVESAGRMTWQGIGAAIAGGVAQYLTPGAAVTALAAVSVAVTVVSRPYVVRASAVPPVAATGPTPRARRCGPPPPAGSRRSPWRGR